MLVSRPLLYAFIYFMIGSYTQCGALRVPPIALLRWLFLFLLTIRSFCDPGAPFHNIFMLNHRILDSLCHLVAVNLLVACMY